MFPKLSSIIHFADVLLGGSYQMIHYGWREPKMQLNHLGLARNWGRLILIWRAPWSPRCIIPTFLEIGAFSIIHVLRAEISKPIFFEPLMSFGGAAAGNAQAWPEHARHRAWLASGGPQSWVALIGVLFVLFGSHAMWKMYY